MPCQEVISSEVVISIVFRYYFYHPFHCIEHYKDQNEDNKKDKTEEN